MVRTDTSRRSASSCAGTRPRVCRSSRIESRRSDFTGAGSRQVRAAANVDGNCQVIRARSPPTDRKPDRPTARRPGREKSPVNTIDPRPVYARATEQAAALIRTVRPEQLDGPTPCTEFDVRALLGHVVGGT